MTLPERWEGLRKAASGDTSHIQVAFSPAMSANSIMVSGVVMSELLSWVERARDMLESEEWRGTYCGELDGTCNICLGAEHKGHKPGCEYAALIAEMS